ncbi:pilus assembly protein TadE [Arthrobacter woluwensis]|nr:pilus assembly protein TadE [Arthrobacter woluwensis]
MLGPFRTSCPRQEQGSAVVDFVLVSGLLTLLFLGVLQLTLILHVRNSLIDAASSGARYGALADRVPDDAVARARELISGAVGPAFAQDITVAEAREGDGTLLTVTIRAPFPVVGLLGPDRVLEVTGHAERVG